MKSEKPVYRAPSLEAHGSLRTITSQTKVDPPEFDSPVNNDLPKV